MARVLSEILLSGFSDNSTICRGSHLGQLAPFESTHHWPSGSDQDNTKDQSKWKRILSNQESARRSRMRKQKHLDDLLLQVAQLRSENIKILTNMKIVIQLFLNVKSQNEVLRALICELNHRLWALNDIVNCINSNRINTQHTPPLVLKILVMIITLIFIITCLMGLMILWNPWSLNIIHANYKPIWASSHHLFMDYRSWR